LKRLKREGTTSFGWLRFVERRENLREAVDKGLGSGL
jgi:hypothetical protein